MWIKKHKRTIHDNNIDYSDDSYKIIKGYIISTHKRYDNPYSGIYLSIPEKVFVQQSVSIRSTHKKATYIRIVCADKPQKEEKKRVRWTVGREAIELNTREIYQVPLLTSSL